MNKTQKNNSEKILNQVKKVAISGTALAILAGINMTGTTQTFASELEQQSIAPINQTVELTDTATVNQVSKSEYNLDSFRSNNDEERRSAIEKAFGIELDEEVDVWADKYNEDKKYTSHAALKVLNSYGMNATRQELIMFGIRTKDWQPYDALDAMHRPAFYEIIDSKVVKNKFYYGWLMTSSIRNIPELQAELKQKKSTGTPEEIESVEKTLEIVKESLVALIEKYKVAPGVTPYVVGLNHNEEIAKENGVEVPGKDFYNSKWNHPDVMALGKFSEAELKKQADKELEAKKLEKEKEAQAEANAKEKSDATEQPGKTDKTDSPSA